MIEGFEESAGAGAAAFGRGTEEGLLHSLGEQWCLVGQDQEQQSRPPSISQPTTLGCRSLPRFCGERDSEVDVITKFKASVRNREVSLGAEVICSLMAQDLGFACPEPFLVEITGEFAGTVLGPAFCGRST